MYGGLQAFAQFFPPSCLGTFAEYYNRWNGILPLFMDDKTNLTKTKEVILIIFIDNKQIVEYTGNRKRRKGTGIMGDFVKLVPQKKGKWLCVRWKNSVSCSPFTAF